ncbi:EAL domain-containing protein [Geobacter sp. DSM 9736]|uniref:EAL domain-containing protein n=1 Tax=Geobacter sp. DSM 9736 TaxID=1277350 RepID=UPI000B4FFBD1|nr:EAL domain-containing protein [Geobacter sp. DSM 9736]SNB47718.1 PAS domain S-box-containing protein/diguanylate cyclase (GGDEF) domain-containing protein [Geobacter sp. DSM 9736]
MDIPAPSSDEPVLLYAEDDHSTREVVQLMINRRFPGVSVYPADNGRTGLEIFHSVKPDIILADMKMPVMDGIRMAREIRKTDQKVRIIITTANTESSRIIEAIDTGINHYVLKPINQGKLFWALEQCIAEVRLEKQLRQQGEHIRKLSYAVEQSPVSVIITDPSGKVEYINPKFTRLTGYTLEEAAGRGACFFHEDEEWGAEHHPLWETLRGGKEWRGELRCRKKDGTVYWASVSVSPVVDGNGAISHFISFHEDISERKQAEETIKHMAYFDALTGLPNRHLFNELLHQAMAQAQRQNRALAILFLDLDRFKVINDTLGHAVGDQLLQAAAQRLKRCCRRERDTVARRGGDEFIVLLPELVDVQEAVRVAQNIIDAFNKPFILPEHELFVSTCVGISIFPHDGTDAETLIKNADMAMYRAKEFGRNRYHLYTPAMDAHAFERLSLENSLRRALQREEFFLHYQPKVDVRAGRISSVEALVRWKHPEFGMVPPTQFIPLVEETGMITALGEWVLQTACAQNKEWLDQGYPPLRMSVNCSPRQFQQLNLAGTVEQTLADTGLDPSLLELEVTENIMLDHEESTMHSFRRLSELGVGIAIDDFGTGYSSLSAIRRLPIQTLKIDKSFINDINSNQDDAAIAKAIITMAQSLRLDVVAEGVETREQMALLDSYDCNLMQGYYFSRPLPAEELTDLLARRNWAQQSWAHA